jgi:hypothetical protein
MIYCKLMKMYGERERLYCSYWGGGEGRHGRQLPATEQNENPEGSTSSTNSHLAAQWHFVRHSVPEVIGFEQRSAGRLS